LVLAPAANNQVNILLFILHNTVLRNIKFTFFIFRILLASGIFVQIINHQTALWDLGAQILLKLKPSDLIQQIMLWTPGGVLEPWLAVVEWVLLECVSACVYLSIRQTEKFPKFSFWDIHIDMLTWKWVNKSLFPWLGAGHIWAQSLILEGTFHLTYFYKCIFENKVPWKADFCLGTSGTLYPETLGRFLFNPYYPPTRSSNCDRQKIAKYFMFEGLDGPEFNKIWSNYSFCIS